MLFSQTNVVEVNLFPPYVKQDFSEVVNFPYYWLLLSCVSHLLVGDVIELGREVVDRFVNFCFAYQTLQFHDPIWRRESMFFCQVAMAINYQDS